MSASLKDFHISNGDWRDSLRKNQRRTCLVIVTFVLIYLCIGLLVDLFIASGHYPSVPLSTLFLALITFKVFPMAMMVVGVVAIISVWAAFIFYDKIMLMGTEYHEITADSARDTQEQQLYHVVEEMKVAAALAYMPRVFVIEADYMNAFASGYSEKSAMVAVTRGLMQKLTRDELSAVIAHELSHIRHRDIQLTLMASVLSNLTLIMIDVLFYSALFGGSDRQDNRSRNNLVWIIILLRYLLPLVTVLLVLYLSRTREYMADAGCVELMRHNEPLASALMKIQGDHVENQDRYARAYQSTPHEAVRREAYIFDPVLSGMKGLSAPSDLFATHPSILKRLAAIGIKSKNN